MVSKCACGHDEAIHSSATGTCLSGYDDFFCPCSAFRNEPPSWGTPSFDNGSRDD